MVVVPVAALVIGWGLGYLMSGPREAGEGGKLDAAESGARSEVGSSGNSRRQNQFSDAVGEGDDSAAAALAAGNVAPGPQLESLLRGALRLTDATDRMVRLREIARSISIANLPGAVESTKRLPMSERWAVMQALGARWAEENPAGAAAFALKDGNEFGWNSLLYGVIDKWASIDQQAAMTWVGTQPGARRIELIRSLIDSVARRNPESALQILKSQPGAPQLSWLNQQIFEQWSQRDPAGAAKSAEALEPGMSREQALQAVAASWAAQDPEAAIKWTESFSDKVSQNKLLRMVAQQWAVNEPKKVIEWAGKLTEPDMRLGILSTAIGQLAQSDAAAAQAHLQTLPTGQERDNLVTQVAYTVSRQDTKAALSMLELLPAGPSRTSATVNMAVQMASTDAKAAGELFLTLPVAQTSGQVGRIAQTMAAGNMEMAREWVDQIPDARMRSQATRSIAGVLAQGNPRAGVEWMMEKEPGGDISRLLQGWVANASDEVLAWAKDLPEGEAKRAAQSAVVQKMIGTDVGKARDLFAKELSPEAQVSTASSLASQWANRDLSSARTWAESLPAGGARENALAGLAGSWANQDAAAAARWMERFSPGDERDRVVTRFAGAVAQRDPEGALAWATSISDPDLRGAQMEQLAGRWLQTDAATAREWIKNTDQLTPGARRRILEQRAQSYYGNQYYGYGYYGYSYGMEYY
jgi:hypothetical protein